MSPSESSLLKNTTSNSGRTNSGETRTSMHNSLSRLLGRVTRNVNFCHGSKMSVFHIDYVIYDDIWLKI